MPTITLTPDQIATLKQSQKMLHDLLPDLDGLEQCGVDCQKMRQQNEDIRAQIAQLEQQFGSRTQSAHKQ